MAGSFNALLNAQPPGTVGGLWGTMSWYAFQCAPERAAPGDFRYLVRR